MIKVGVKVTGLKELNRNLIAMGKAGQKVLKTAVKDGAKVVAADVKARVPVGSKPHRFREKGKIIFVMPGNLRKNIKPRLVPKNKVQGADMAVVVAYEGRAFYGRWLEWGWRSGKARKYVNPYKRPKYLESAWDSKRDEALRVTAARLRVLIETEAARLGAQNAR